MPPPPNGAVMSNAPTAPLINQVALTTNIQDWISRRNQVRESAVAQAVTDMFSGSPSSKLWTATKPFEVAGKPVYHCSAGDKAKKNSSVTIFFHIDPANDNQVVIDGVGGHKPRPTNQRRQSPEYVIDLWGSDSGAFTKGATIKLGK